MAPLAPRTLVDQVVDAIIRAASDGNLKPQERVVEAEIARQLQISRVPVREALRLLESQGIVENVPYRGMRLMRVDADSIVNTLKVRFALERLAVEDYVKARQKTDIDLAPLARCLEQMKIAARYGDSYKVAVTDTEFHRIICSLTGNKVLLETWEPLARKITIIFGIAAVQKGLDSIVQEHVELYDAIEKADRKRLVSLLETHIFAYLDLVGDTVDGVLRMEPKAPVAASRARRAKRRAS